MSRGKRWGFSLFLLQSLCSPLARHAGCESDCRCTGSPAEAGLRLDAEAEDQVGGQRCCQHRKDLDLRGCCPVAHEHSVQPVDVSGGF